MTAFNDNKCLETKQGKYTKLQNSKFKQVYCFKVRQEHKKIYKFAGETFNKAVLLTKKSIESLFSSICRYLGYSNIIFYKPTEN